MKTLTLASIYEIQGHTYEAAEIYKTILEEDLTMRKPKLPSSVL